MFEIELQEKTENIHTLLVISYLPRQNTVNIKNSALLTKI